MCGQLETLHSLPSSVSCCFFFFPSPVTGLASWNHFVVATFGNGCIDVIDTLNLVLTARVNAHAK
jgi:hypothetical protein